MILVDSSVWIDYLRGIDAPHVECLDALLGVELLAIGDLILAEVLQGVVDDREFLATRKLLLRLDVVTLGGRDIALKAAEHYRILRGHGVTIRKTIDCIIATRCIVDGLGLLHNDRDFDPFTKYLGLDTVT